MSGTALAGAYPASKAAVTSLVQRAGPDPIRHGTTVGAIAPGVVDTQHRDDVDRRFARRGTPRPGDNTRAAAVPIGRMARPDEIAGLATFPAGGDARDAVARTCGTDGGNWVA